MSGDEIVILLNEPAGYGIDRDHLERITRLAYTQLGLEIVLFASGTVDSLDQLPIVSKQCQRCQAHQPWAEQQRIFIWEDIQASFSGVTPDTRAYENQIFASINDNSQLNLSIIRRIFDAFQENGASFSELKRRCLRILTVAKFLENGYQLDFDPEDRINTVRTASKLYSEMESVLQSLNLSVEKAAVPSIQDKVLAYVHDHFHENISLEQLAAKLFLSPSYLGRVLRTDLGMPFHEWLNRYRINRACELLKNRNLKTSEIALMVGFSSYKYFSQIFAQHIGCSTREYRNRLIGSV
jgi:YesN/AraC family two-component response regulator